MKILACEEAWPCRRKPRMFRSKERLNGRGEHQMRYMAGHGWKEDQSMLCWNASSAGKMVLKVKAN